MKPFISLIYRLIRVELGAAYHMLNHKIRKFLHNRVVMLLLNLQQLVIKITKNNIFTIKRPEPSYANNQPTAGNRCETTKVGQLNIKPSWDLVLSTVKIVEQLEFKYRQI